MFETFFPCQEQEKPIALEAAGFFLFSVTRRGFAGFWCGAPQCGDVKINAIMEIALRSKMLTEIAHGLLMKNRPQKASGAARKQLRLVFKKLPR